MKLIVEIICEPTTELSSRIVIPSIAPAGAVHHCGAPAPLDEVFEFPVGSILSHYLILIYN